MSGAWWPSLRPSSIPPSWRARAWAWPPSSGLCCSVAASVPVVANRGFVMPVKTRSTKPRRGTHRLAGPVNGDGVGNLGSEQDAVQMRDSIADVWGERTPYAGDWPSRVDEHLELEV